MTKLGGAKQDTSKNGKKTHGTWRVTLSTEVRMEEENRKNRNHSARPRRQKHRSQTRLVQSYLCFINRPFEVLLKAEIMY